MLFFKIFLRHYCSCIAVIYSWYVKFFQIILQLFKNELIRIYIVIVEICINMKSIDFSFVDIFKRDSASRWRLAVPLNIINGSVNGSNFKPYVNKLLSGLFLFLAQKVFNKIKVTLVEYIFNLTKFHAKFFHILNHVKPRILLDVIVSIMRVFINITRLQQSHRVIQAQCCHSCLVHLSHLAYAYVIL